MSILSLLGLKKEDVCEDNSPIKIVVEPIKVKSTIRIYKGTSFDGYYVSHNKEHGEVTTSHILSNARLISTYEEKNKIFSELKEILGTGFQFV